MEPDQGRSAVVGKPRVCLVFAMICQAADNSPCTHLCQIKVGAWCDVPRGHVDHAVVHHVAQAVHHCALLAPVIQQERERERARGRDGMQCCGQIGMSSPSYVTLNKLAPLIELALQLDWPRAAWSQWALLLLDTHSRALQDITSLQEEVALGKSPSR